MYGLEKLSHLYGYGNMFSIKDPHDSSLTFKRKFNKANAKQSRAKHHFFAKPMSFVAFYANFQHLKNSFCQTFCNRLIILHGLT